MTPSFVMDVGSDTIITILWVTAPIMAVGFVVGITISLIQAIMQIQEMTLAFVPKLVAIGMALIFFGHWMITELMKYTEHLLGGFHKMVGG